MTIQDALDQADNADVNTIKHISDDVWALRVLAEAYRQEKVVTANLYIDLKIANSELDAIAEKAADASL